MKIQTHIATTLDSLPAEMLLIDQSIKELLADVQILARILKYTVSEMKDADIEEIISHIDESQIEIGSTPIDPGLTNYGKVQALVTEDIVLNEGTIYFDIRFPVRYGKDAIKIIINIEAQNRIRVSELKYHLENRITYYLSRLISSQKNVEFFNSDYDSIKKVYSIWICTGSGVKNDSINELCFVQRNIFGEEQSFTELDKMNAVIITLRLGVHKEESCHRLIAMLEDLLSEKDAAQKKKLLEEKHDIKMTTNMERRIANMCNLSEYILENAIENAMEKGIEKGMGNGIEKERHTVIARMLRNGKTVEDIVDFCGYEMEEVLAIQREILKEE